MKYLIALIVIIIGGLFAWGLASNLSADALGMAVGMIFGILAGVPSALLVLAANRRDTGSRYDDDDAPRQAPAWQPAVIVIAAGSQPQQWPGKQIDGYYPALPGPGAPAISDRVFRVVGERAEWLDEW